MKKFILLILLIFLLSPSYTFAWRWYGIQNPWMAWHESSNTRSCIWWRILIDSRAYRGQARNWSAACLYRDDVSPTISIGYNWYTEWQWVKDDEITLTIRVNDTISWLSKVSYNKNWDWIVNIPINNWNVNDFNVTFNTEWANNLYIYAEDKAFINSYNWANTYPNASSKNVSVNIDRSAPIFTTSPATSTWWINTNVNIGFQNINFKIEDTYRWQWFVTKSFNCWSLPNNAIWSAPSTDVWVIIGSCDTGSRDCNNDSDFTPNLSSCNYSCDTWFIKWNDWLCYEENIILKCDNQRLPTEVFVINKDWFMESEWSSLDKVIWSSPTWVSLDWEFYSAYSETTSAYIPNINQCVYTCNDWYHNNNNNCINDVKIVCCNVPVLSNSTLWTVTDCSIVSNQSNVECSYSSVCWWQKELYWEWNYTNTNWDYTTTTDWTLNWEVWFWRQCGYNNFNNSNWDNCDYWFYLINANNWKPLLCENVWIWEWSWRWNTRGSCTNKPSNSFYTSWWTNNNCSWTCNAWYTKRWNNCEKNEWVIWNYWACTEDCWSWRKYRIVECKYNWNVLNDDECIDQKPIEDEECNTQACVVDSYSWHTWDWWSCNPTCWKWTQTREVNCIKNNIITDIVVDNNCSWNKPENNNNCINWNDCKYSRQDILYWNNDEYCTWAIQNEKDIEFKEYLRYSRCIEKYNNNSFDTCYKKNWVYRIRKSISECQ